MYFILTLKNLNIDIFSQCSYVFDLVKISSSGSVIVFFLKRKWIE